MNRVAVIGVGLVVGACGGGSAQPASAFTPSTKGKLTSFAVAPTSGQVDRIGQRDGAFTPDGVPDLVFTADLDGPAVGIAIVSVDGNGQANGGFRADTLVGEQVVPLEISSDVRMGESTAGVGVFEGDVLVNAKDGSLSPLAAGPHKLTLHVSASNAPRPPFRAYAIFDDRSVAESPVAR